jgi:predicted amidophosphoribosyltransferase
MDGEEAGRLRAFVERYGDTVCPICVVCLTEFVPGTEICSSCGKPLAPGAEVVSRIRERLAADEVRRAGDVASASIPARSAVDGDADGASDSEAPPRACERCGQPVDASTGACEPCLLAIVRDEERRDADVEPDAAEAALVDTWQRFLDEHRDPRTWFCPACLAEFSGPAHGCAECGKGVVPLADAREHVQRSLADLTAGWFFPLADDAEPLLFLGLIELLETAAGPGSARPEFCVTERQTGFSPVLAHHTGYRRTLFVKRRDAARILRALQEADLGGADPVALAAVRERLLRLTD